MAELFIKPYSRHARGKCKIFKKVRVCPIEFNAQIQIVDIEQQGVHDLDDTAEGGLLGPPDVMRGSAGTRSVPGGFGLRYDDESEIQSIDVAGPGQQERCVSCPSRVAELTIVSRLAEFVSREIDNNSQGLDVAASMKVLGLQRLEFLLLYPNPEFTSWKRTTYSTWTRVPTSGSSINWRRVVSRVIYASATLLSHPAQG